MLPLNDIFKRFNQRNYIAKKAVDSLVVEFVKEYLKVKFSDKVYSMIKAVTYKDGVITIRSDSSLIRNEVKFFQNELLSEIVAKFGQNVVKQIK